MFITCYNAFIHIVIIIPEKSLQFVFIYKFVKECDLSNGYNMLYLDIIHYIENTKKQELGDIMCYKHFL